MKNNNFETSGATQAPPKITVPVNFLFYLDHEALETFRKEKKRVSIITWAKHMVCIVRPFYAGTPRLYKRALCFQPTELSMGVVSWVAADASCTKLIARIHPITG